MPYNSWLSKTLFVNVFRKSLIWNMRPLALFLTGLITFLSCFSGLVKADAARFKIDCCSKSAHACRHASKQKKPANDGCDQPGCATMFSCTICGFFIRQPLTLQPLNADHLPKPVAHYISREPAGYSSDNWKPPQTWLIIFPITWTYPSNKWSFNK